MIVRVQSSCLYIYTPRYSAKMILSVTVLYSVIICISARCCNYGTTQSYPASSCMEIIRYNPACRGLSGYYWLESTNGTTYEVHCDMSRMGGGWERIAYFDSLSSSTCPGTMANYSIGSHLLCTNNGSADNIASANYSTDVSSFSQVMGLMKGYISHAGYGFAPMGTPATNLEEVYMDGISLGINDGTGFMKHVHSTVATDYAQSLNNSIYSCFVLGQGDSYIPSTVGADHTCSVLTSSMYMPLNGIASSTMQPFGDMWSGSCDTLGFYCRHVHRHFVKMLSKDYSGTENTLSVRVMSRNGVTVGLSRLEIYIR